jgi:hypothetical protein
MNREGFKPVFGFEGFYEIKEPGIVWSVQRTIIRSNGTPQTWRAKEIATHISYNGYKMVNLSVVGESFGRTIHSMLVETFKLNGKIPKGMCVNHIDGDKLNNQLDNLEVGTYSHNKLHALRTGLDDCIGETHPTAKLNRDQAEEIKERYSKGERIYKLAPAYNVSEKTIRNIVFGVHWKSDKYLDHLSSLNKGK